MRELNHSRWPMWCGACDNATRLVELSEIDGWHGRVMRCPTCHPAGPYVPSWLPEPA